MRLKSYIPLVIFSLLVGVFYQASTLKTPLQHRVPAFSAETLDQHPVQETLFSGRVTLLHVWASWCPLCQQEQFFWLEIGKTWPYALMSLNYQDTRAAAQQWLETYGDPYTLTISDPTGQVAAQWGIVGAPETYLIDAQGQIRYHVRGALDPTVFYDTVLPLASQLAQELSE